MLVVPNELGSRNERQLGRKRYGRMDGQGVEASWVLQLSWTEDKRGGGKRGYPLRSRGLSLEGEEERGGGSHASLEAGGDRGRRCIRCNQAPREGVLVR